jgi:hypothetical protein
MFGLSMSGANGRCFAVTHGLFHGLADGDVSVPGWRARELRLGVGLGGARFRP